MAIIHFLVPMTQLAFLLLFSQAISTSQKKCTHHFLKMPWTFPILYPCSNLSLSLTVTVVLCLPGKILILQSTVANQSPVWKPFPKHSYSHSSLFFYPFSFQKSIIFLLCAFYRSFLKWLFWSLWHYCMSGAYIIPFLKTVCLLFVGLFIQTSIQHLQNAYYVLHTWIYKFPNSSNY